MLILRASWRAFYASDLAFGAPASPSSPQASSSDHAVLAVPPPHARPSWFADARAEPRTADFLAALRPRLSRTRTSFLDLGTGNGSILRLLRRRGWRGAMVGADYCAESVELARQLEKSGSAVQSDDDEESEAESDAEEDKTEEPDADAAAPPIAFHEYDILHSDSSDAPWRPTAPEGFDVVLDKGTFDAVSLSPDMDTRGRRACDGYAAAVLPLVRPGGGLLVTSCNWTEEELVQWFVRRPVGAAAAVPSDGFEVCGRVAYPRFRFGGREGQSVVGVCFRRTSPS